MLVIAFDWIFRFGDGCFSYRYFGICVDILDFESNSFLELRYRFEFL